MSLLDTLSLPSKNGTCVAVVGAGGKTSLGYQLVRAAVARGQRAIFTTTTRIWRPQAGVFDVLDTQGVEGVKTRWTVAWRTACVVSAEEAAGDRTPVAESYMPVVHTKLIGLRAADVCQLHQPFPDALVIVEADGARGLRLKAPAGDEPQIPPCADVVCVLAQIDVIGQPLGAPVAHRVERISALTGLQPGEAITADALTLVLAHADGGLKDVPARARKVAVLTQRDAANAHPTAPIVAQALIGQGYDMVLAMSPRAREPVLGRWTG